MLPDGMSLYELYKICSIAYQKALIGSALGRVKEHMEPTLKYLEKTCQIIVKGGVVKLKNRL